MKRGFRSLGAVKREVLVCRLCPRLVSYRESVKPRASYAAQRYWRRPVPGFGDVKARLLIVGLAPAAHGGNRTGRVFTGDESGRFLVRALYRAGFANQPISESGDDGLVYRDCYLTAAVKCAPPGDEPSRLEFKNCSRYLDAEFSLLTNVRAVLALGASAFRAVLDLAEGRGARVSKMKFAHHGVYSVPGLPRVYASYHPSPRNTNTGKLTEAMMVALLEDIKSAISRD